jgi:hypothetical protein
MNAKYNFGGISKFLGVFKVRVGQGDMATRIKSMHKKGHTDIDMVEFDGKMTKAEVCQELLKVERFKKFTDVINETYNKKTGLAVAKASPAKSAAVKKEKAVDKPKQTKKEKVSAVKKPKVVIQKPIDDDLDLEIEELKNLVV